ncbi:unnamed protein product [Caenorhabditis brenneri]
MTKPKATGIKEEKKPNIEAKFTVGEEFVLIYKVDGLPYKAKVLAVNANNSHPHYDVHYVGWSASFDSKIYFTEQDKRMFKGTVEEYKAEHPVESTSIEKKVGEEKLLKKKSTKRPATSTSTAAPPTKKTVKSSKATEPSGALPKKTTSKSPATKESSAAPAKKKKASNK